MKKLTVLAFSLLVFCPSVSAGAEILVVTTVPDLAWIVGEVGGDRVEVKAICRGYQDPHYLEAKPSYTRDLRKADALVFVGLELEVAWLPQLLSAARNPRLRPGSPGLVDASSGVSNLLGVPTEHVDRSQGDIHPFGNPHYLLDPRNIAPVADRIAAALSHVDPAGGDQYQSRAGELRDTMAIRIAEWEARAAPINGKPVVAFHKQWEYVTEWLGLEIAGYIENRPGVPSTPRHVNNLIKSMKERDVGLVVAAPFVDVHAAEAVANRAGARLAVLPPSVGASDDAGTYPEMIDAVLSGLLGAGPGS